MSNLENRLRISNMAFNNTEALIKNYAVENKKLHRIKDRKERAELANKFTIALNGMMLLMSELDRNRTIDLLDKYALINTVERAISRLQTDESVALVC